MRRGYTLALALVVACAEPVAEPALRDGCSPREFPPIPALRHATGLRIEAGSGYRRVEITQPWPDAQRSAVFFLLDCGAAAPLEEPEAVSIRVPVARLASSAAVQVAQLEALGALESLVAHAGTNALWSPAARARANSGALRDLGLEGPLDLERVAASTAQVFLANPLSGADDHRDRLAQLGILALPHAEWLEPHPLGRAEWLHLTAALVGREHQAIALFDQVEAGWTGLEARLAGAARGPRVFTGLPWRGTWWQPGNRSATAQLVEAAGGRWAFPMLEGSANFPVDLELVLAQAADAKVWLGPGTARTRAEVLAIEPRASALQAFEAGLVLVPDLRTTTTGGNDWWESALVRPDWAAIELASWLRPESVAVGERRWLRSIDQPLAP